MATDMAAEIVADVRLERHRAHVLTSVAGQWLRDNGWYGVQSSSPPGGIVEEDKEETQSASFVVTPLVHVYFQKTVKPGIFKTSQTAKNIDQPRRT